MHNMIIITYPLPRFITYLLLTPLTYPLPRFITYPYLPLLTPLLTPFLGSHLPPIKPIFTLILTHYESTYTSCQKSVHFEQN